MKNGLTVVTGETGAGKSIMLAALLLVLGERVSGKIHRDNSKPVIISAIFQATPIVKEKLQELGLEISSEIILRRTVTPDGKSKAYVNDINVSVASLALFREALLEICGQHDSRGLLNATTHIDVLDTFGGYANELLELKKAFTDYTAVKKELVLLREKSQKADFEVKYLKGVVEELSSLNVKPDEEEQLAEERKILSEGQKAQDTYHKSQDIINDGIITKLFALERELNRFPEIFSEPLGLVKTAIIEVEEAKNSLDDLGGKIGASDGRLEKIEDRLFKIRSAARKYNVLPNQLVDFLAAKQEELDNFSDLNERLAKKEKELAVNLKSYLALAESVSQRRNKTAEKLRATVLAQLKEVKLDKADFKVEVTGDKSEANYGGKGFDSVHFLVCTNPGTPYGALDKIASGGEMSRIMLALKVALADVKSVPLLIFDEIDTGISGAVSHAVGKKLAVLAKNYQVLAITHQPQVAAYSDNHWLVAKQHGKNDTSVTLRELSATEKNHEIARMLSGDKLTQESLAAAKKLIQAAA